MARHAKVVNESDLDWVLDGHGERFASERKPLGTAAGAQKLGCSLYRLAPGKRAFPMHYHFANEESVYILEGSGTMRIGDRRVEVSKGDYIAFPTGPETAHQLINTSEEPLVYLCLSTMVDPDVMVYPDSGKTGVAAGSAPGGDKDKRLLLEFHRTDNKVPYWDGEA